MKLHRIRCCEGMVSFQKRRSSADSSSARIFISFSISKRTSDGSAIISGSVTGFGNGFCPATVRMVFPAIR